jgi:hypothetical protein
MTQKQPAISQPLSNATNLMTFYALVMSWISRPFHVGHLGVMSGQAVSDEIATLAKLSSMNSVSRI